MSEKKKVKKTFGQKFVTSGVAGVTAGVLLAGGLLVDMSPAHAQQTEIDALRRQITELTERLDKMEADQKKAAEAAAKASTVKADSPSVKLSGYIQGEFRRQFGEARNSDVTDLDVRRARLKVDAKVSDNASLTLQADLARTVELRDAYFDIGLGAVKLRGGQFKVPLSYQILESSATRLTPERALINTRSIPGERDRGFQLDVPIRRGSTTSPVLQFAVFGGRGINQSDNNTDKDFVGAIHVPFNQRLSGRLSYLRGRYKNVDNEDTPIDEGGEVTKRRIMADLQYDKTPWNLQLQYGVGKGDFPTAGGNVSDTDVRGGYAQVAYQFKKMPFWLVGRYQEYDREDLEHGKIDGPLLGAVYDFSKAVRLLAAYERLDDESREGKRSLFTVRTQVRF